ncbi:MAG: hypothetical protein EOL87_02195 [Spartobacteria bacterium]|nr:hypothetical protein [Spartobacteria bacterium]
MKFFNKKSLWVTLLFMLCADLSAHAWMYNLSHEYVSSGDFDGNGLEDALLVNKTAGTLRIGYQITGSNVTWSAELASGLQNISACTVGKVISTNRDAIALASSDTNRVTILDLSDFGQSIARHYVTPRGEHISSMAAVPFEGEPYTPYDDLYFVSNSNDAPSICGRSFATSYGNGVFTNGTTLFRSPTISENVNALSLHSSAPKMVMGLNLFDGEQYVDAWSITNSSGIQSRGVLTEYYLSGTSNRYVAGNFNGWGNAFIIYYTPGTARLTNDYFSMNNAYNYYIQPYTGYGVRTNISYVMDGGIITNRTRIVIIYEDGTADVTPFTQYNSPFQTLTAGTGSVIRAAIPLGTNQLVTFNADSSTDAAGYFEERTWNGSTYQTVNSGSFQAQEPISQGSATVLAFDADPFVSVSAQKVGAWSQQDWTRNIDTSALPASVSVSYATDSGTTYGLSANNTVNLGSANAAAVFGLVNRLRDDVSVSMTDAAYGNVVLDLSAEPASGQFSTYVLLQLTPIPADATVYYRLSSEDNWSIYTAPLPLFSDTTVESYIKKDGYRSAVKTYSYTFTKSVDALDSDNDGVPDYVELASDVDPIESGPDADGDGLMDIEECYYGTDLNKQDTDGDTWDDLAELRAGTDPLDPNDHPVQGYVVSNTIQRLRLDARFNLAVTPRAVDSASNYSNYTAYTQYSCTVADSNQLTLYTMNSGIQGQVLTETSRATLTNLYPQSPWPLSIMSTPEVYTLQGKTTNELGRELVGFYAQPDIEDVQVPYTNQGASYVTEAANWKTAAKNNLTFGDAPTYQTDLEIRDALSALLFEKKVADLLVAQGKLTTNIISLFPFRAGDAERYTPPAEDLEGLQYATNGLPGHNLVSLFTNIDQAVSQNSGAITNTVNLAVQLWGIAGEYSDQTNGVAGLPFDTLRSFLYTGELIHNYRNFVSLSTATIQSAYDASSTLLQNLPSRSTTNLNLLVQTNTYQDVGMVLETALGIPYILYRNGQTPMRSGDAVRLLPDTEVAVTAYNDLGEEPNVGTRLEVISMNITSLPLAGPTPTPTPTGKPGPTATPAPSSTPTASPTPTPTSTGGSSNVLNWLILLLGH